MYYAITDNHKRVNGYYRVRVSNPFDDTPEGSSRQRRQENKNA